MTAIRELRVPSSGERVMSQLEVSYPGVGNEVPIRRHLRYVRQRAWTFVQHWASLRMPRATFRSGPSCVTPAQTARPIASSRRHSPMGSTVRAGGAELQLQYDTRALQTIASGETPSSLTSATTARYDALGKGQAPGLPMGMFDARTAYEKIAGVVAAYFTARSSPGLAGSTSRRRQSSLVIFHTSTPRFCGCTLVRTEHRQRFPATPRCWNGRAPCPLPASR